MTIFDASTGDRVPGDEVLPCGCVIRCRVIDDVNTLFYIPCHQTCVNYLNAIGLANERGLPIEKRLAP